MRSRRLALPPRCGSMLSSRCSLKTRGTGTCWYLRYLRYLLLVLLRYTYTLLNRTPARWY